MRRYADCLAGFCLVANGAYIGLAAIEGVADSGEMLRNCSPHWLLYLFGVAATAAGLWVWHRTSEEFGFGQNPRSINVLEASLAALAAVAITTAIAILGHR